MKKPDIEILRREHQMLQEDLTTNRDHLNRITCAAQRLGEAIKLLSKPQSNLEPRRVLTIVVRFLCSIALSAEHCSP